MGNPQVSELLPVPLPMETLTHNLLNFGPLERPWVSRPLPVPVPAVTPTKNLQGLRNPSRFLLAEGQVYINGCINSITIYICLIDSYVNSCSTDIILFRCCHASIAVSLAASSQTARSISKQFLFPILSLISVRIDY